MPEEIDTSKMSAEEIAELQKQNCIFCKIASKQIPAKILHEDDKVICILDINPASEGHILVFPKEHYMILPHIPDELLNHLFKTAQLMSKTLLKTLQSGGTCIFIANGAAAGQKAPHVLIHVFPRRVNDGLIELPKYEMSDEQIIKLTSTLKPYFLQVFGKNKSANLNNIAPYDSSSNRREINAISERENDYAEKEDNHTEKKSEKNKESFIKKETTEKDTTNKKDHKKLSNRKVSNKKDINLDDITKLFGG